MYEKQKTNKKHDESGRGHGGRDEGGRGQGGRDQGGSQGGRGQGGSGGGRGQGGRGQGGSEGSRGQGGSGGGRGQGENGGGRDQGGNQGGRGQGGSAGGRGQGGSGGGRGQGGSGGGEFQEFSFGGRGQSGKGQSGGKGKGGKGGGKGKGEFGGAWGKTEEFEGSDSIDMVMDNLDGKSFKEMYSMVKKMPKSMLEDAIGEHNKEIQQFLYENYNEEEVKKMEKLIAKRMKEEDSMFDMVDFPMEMLPSLGEFVEEDDMFDAMLENMNDEQFDTLMDQFENMDLSETIGGWNARKKRSVYGNYLSKKDKYRSNKKGHSSFKDMLGKMMNGKGKERMPKEVKDISLFVKELIFMPDEEAQSMLGSRLPAALKSSMREVIMGFLTDDIPMGTLKLFGKFAYHMKKSLSKMVKGLLPVSEDAVNEMFEKITKKIENKTTSGNESMGASKNDWNMLKVIFSAVDKEVKEGVTLVAQKLQGNIINKDNNYIYV